MSYFQTLWKNFPSTVNNERQVSGVKTNASIAEENAAASEELSGQAGELANVVARFQLHNEDEK